MTKPQGIAAEETRAAWRYSSGAGAIAERFHAFQDRKPDDLGVTTRGLCSGRLHDGAGRRLIEERPKKPNSLTDSTNWPKSTGFTT